MLTVDPQSRPEYADSRLIVEPPVAVRLSVLPGDPAAATAGGVEAGIPAALLARFGAVVRQTHRRANVVVIDVPAERRDALAAALRAIGIAARPPVIVRPLLHDSVPLLRVPTVWRRGYTGAGIRVAVVDTGIDASHPDLAHRIVASADHAGMGAGDDVGHGTHVAGIIAGEGTVYRGV